MGTENPDTNQGPLHKLQNMKLLIRLQLILFSYVAFAGGMALSSWWLKGHTISRIVTRALTSALHLTLPDTTV